MCSYSQSNRFIFGSKMHLYFDGHHYWNRFCLFCVWSGLVWFGCTSCDCVRLICIRITAALHSTACLAPLVAFSRSRFITLNNCSFQYHLQSKCVGLCQAVPSSIINRIVLMVRFRFRYGESHVLKCHSKASRSLMNDTLVAGHRKSVRQTCQRRSDRHTGQIVDERGRWQTWQNE